MNQSNFQTTQSAQQKNFHPGFVNPNPISEYRSLKSKNVHNYGNKRSQNQKSNWNGNPNYSNQQYFDKSLNAKNSQFQQRMGQTLTQSSTKNIQMNSPQQGLGSKNTSKRNNKLNPRNNPRNSQKPAQDSKSKQRMNQGYSNQDSVYIPPHVVQNPYVRDYYRYEVQEYGRDPPCRYDLTTCSEEDKAIYLNLAADRFKRERRKKYIQRVNVWMKDQSKARRSVYKKSRQEKIDDLTEKMIDYLGCKSPTISESASRRGSLTDEMFVSGGEKARLNTPDAQSQIFNQEFESKTKKVEPKKQKSYLHEFVQVQSFSNEVKNYDLELPEEVSDSEFNIFNQKKSKQPSSVLPIYSQPISDVESPINELNKTEKYLVDKKARETHEKELKIRDMAKYKIFFGGVPKNCKVLSIYQYFRSFGEIKTFKLQKWKKFTSAYGCNFLHRGCGVINYVSAESVEAILGGNHQDPRYKHVFKLTQQQIDNFKHSKKKDENLEVVDQDDYFDVKQNKFHATMMKHLDLDPPSSTEVKTKEIDNLHFSSLVQIGVEDNTEEPQEEIDQRIEDQKNFEERIKEKKDWYDIEAKQYQEKKSFTLESQNDQISDHSSKDDLESDEYDFNLVQSILNHQIEGKTFECRRYFNDKQKKRRSDSIRKYCKKIYLNFDDEKFNRVTKQQVYNVMCNYGHVEEVIIIEQDSNGQSGSFVIFKNRDDANSIIGKSVKIGKHPCLVMSAAEDMTTQNKPKKNLKEQVQEPEEQKWQEKMNNIKNGVGGLNSMLHPEKTVHQSNLSAKVNDHDSAPPNTTIFKSEARGKFTLKENFMLNIGVTPAQALCFNPDTALKVNVKKKLVPINELNEETNFVFRWVELKEERSCIYTDYSQFSNFNSSQLQNIPEFHYDPITKENLDDFVLHRPQLANQSKKKKKNIVEANGDKSKARINSFMKQNPIESIVDKTPFIFNDLNPKKVHLLNGKSKNLNLQPPRAQMSLQSQQFYPMNMLPSQQNFIRMPHQNALYPQHRAFNPKMHQPRAQPRIFNPSIPRARAQFNGPLNQPIVTSQPPKQQDEQQKMIENMQQMILMQNQMMQNLKMEQEIQKLKQEQMMNTMAQNNQSSNPQGNFAQLENFQKLINQQMDQLKSMVKK